MKDRSETMKMLWQDAKDRGMIELAIVYGWSAVRLGSEKIQAATKELKID